ncbi:MAG: L,D-transpeptidase family protein [Hyphomicrobium sp.]
MRRSVQDFGLSIAAFAALFLTLLSTGPLRAETTAGELRIAAVEAIDSRAAVDLEALVVAELLARKFALKSEPVEAAWVQQLLGFYSAAGASTVWVEPGGVSPRGRQAIDELRRADEYALEPARLNIPPALSTPSDERALARFEVAMSLAVARYAWHARGGRMEPTSLSLWLDYTPRPGNAAEVIGAIQRAGDIEKAFGALHPQHRQFDALRRALLLETSGSASATELQPMIPMGVRIRPNRRHPDVALARLRLSAPARDGDHELLDSDFQKTLFEFMNETARIHYGRKRGIDDDVRVALNGGSAASPVGGSLGGDRAKIDLIRANMERWRWLPRDLGDLYVWNNLPEFQTRVVKAGEVIHQERIIIGQPDTQTPVFSDSILRVIFNPDWNVPESIKLSSLWGNLRGGDFGVLKRRNMKIMHDGREVNPAKLKFDVLNAREVPIVMAPGPGNPLGKFKFVFPNKHDVYMHDTTSKGLFNSNVRTFSHGCIRVRDPQRFAEVLLAEGRGWNKADVRWQMRTKAMTRLELDRAIPIHNTYFTLVADASGKLQKLNDVYGHDKRIIDALNGVDPKRIAASDPAMAQKRKNEQLANAPPVVVPAKIASKRLRAPAVDQRLPPPSLFFKPPPPARPYVAVRSGLTRAVRPRGLLYW